MLMKMGSTHDIKKEDAEEQCFQKAYDEAIKRGGKTAELMTFFYGVPLESREKNDRPDLIRICRKGKRNPKDVIVGIEHFRVDQLSVKRGSCYKSRGREIEKQLWNIYEAGHEELNRDGIVSISSATKVLNSIAELSKETIRRKYQDLLSGFDYVLAKHLKSVKEYRENVMKYSDGRPVEIAFLIEISSKFPQMFLNEKGRTSVKNDGLMPSALSGPVLDFLMPKITLLGNGGAIWILAALILLCTKKYRRQGVLLLVGLIAGVLVGNACLKNLIARPRPCWLDSSVQLLIANPADYSFPSGHTLSSVIGATGLTKTNRRFGYAAIPLAALIAFSRLYLYVHFPSDVLAAAVLGVALGELVWRCGGKLLERWHAPRGRQRA